MIRKSYEVIEEEPAEEQEPDDVPIVDAMAVDNKAAAEAPAEESKEAEEEVVEEAQTAEPDESAQAEAESKEASEAKKAKEESPVMVEVEPKEAQRQEAEARHVEERLQRYEKVAERVGKCASLKYKGGKLKIKVLRATNVDKKDLGLCLCDFARCQVCRMCDVRCAMCAGKSDLSDVFVKVEVPGCHHKQTKIQKDAVNPVWNEAFELKVRDIYKDALSLTLLDHDTMMNDTIGEVQVPIIQVVAARDSALKNKGFRVKGSKTGCMLFLDVHYVEEPGKKKK